jgi:hypothetical protein
MALTTFNTPFFASSVSGYALSKRRPNVVLFQRVEDKVSSFLEF